MRITFTFMTLLLVSASLWSQPSIKITPLTDMPIAVANNAVVAANVNGREYVYSFGGIATGLTYADITQQSFRYDVLANTWDTLPPLPDTLGKLAMAASYVNGKIYIIGGYHVLPNGNEISSNRVHVFNPATNTYLPDAAPVPLPIDDHVQTVWRDSLIYVVAGWTTAGHVTNVQIYNPVTDTWSVGSPIPNTYDYKAFGASGVAIDDTIYYMGGARTGLSFPAAPELRKGVIDPADPAQINWSYSVYFGTAGYRMASAILDDWAVWLGGSSTTYNYNAAAYDGSGVVFPENRIILYNPTVDSLAIYTDSLPLPTMDHRGVGQLDGNRFIICGGIIDNAVASSSNYLVENLNPTGIRSATNKFIGKVYPIPANDKLMVETSTATKVSLWDLMGRLVVPAIEAAPGEQTVIATSTLPQGSYVLLFESINGVAAKKVMITR